MHKISQTIPEHFTLRNKIHSISFTVWQISKNKLPEIEIKKKEEAVARKQAKRNDQRSKDNAKKYADYRNTTQRTESR